MKNGIVTPSDLLNVKTKMIAVRGQPVLLIYGRVWYAKSSLAELS